MPSVNWSGHKDQWTEDTEEAPAKYGETQESILEVKRGD